VRELRRGQAADEVQGFTTHQRLMDASQPGFPPKLFHKAALEGDEDSSLAGDIRQALANRKQRVVGIVINAVDDHLDKGTRSMRSGPCSTSACSNRFWPRPVPRSLVILLSDHGHILDRQTEYRQATDGLVGGARWGRNEGRVRGEFAPSSYADGNRVVVPWSERLRYGAKKNGYTVG